MPSKEFQANMDAFMKRQIEEWTSPEYIEGSKPMYTFEVNVRQAVKLAAWREQHDTKCKYSMPENQGAIGGRFTYKFCHTNLGTIVHCECACGETKDVSDYGEW